MKFICTLARDLYNPPNYMHKNLSDMIERDQNITKAIDSMVEGEVLGAKRQLVRMYSLLELCAIVILVLLSVYYFLQSNLTIGLFLVTGASIVAYNMLALKFYPKIAVSSTIHYYLLSATLCVGLLWFGLDGAYWSIPIIASSYYVIPLRHAFYLSCSVALYLICITPLFGDFATAFRVIAILILASGSTALYATALKKQQQALALLSVTDPLTGAFNRLYLNYSLNNILERQHEHGISSTVALLDINNFKHVNTAYGHDGGDKALMRLVEIAKAYIPEKHSLFRYGGDEFIIVFDACNEKEAASYVDLIQKALQQLTHKPHEIPISFSVGFASTNANSTLEDLLNICDRAMYQEKNIQLA